MQFTSGSRVGVYEVIAPIGSGGMGEVYRARDTVLGRDVALKVLTREANAEVDGQNRFENEARAVAALDGRVKYRVWKEDGEVALTTAGWHAISDAVERGAGRVEMLALGHRYGHLSPLATVA